MNPQSKIFALETIAEFEKKISESNFGTTKNKIASNLEGHVPFEVVMSTEDEDRQGDSLDQSKWDFTYFKMNPVLLWAHNYQEPPIGVVTDLSIQGRETIIKGYFALDEDYDWAGVISRLYVKGILNAVSPGYIVNSDGTRELLEVSFCPVPAGRYAVRLRDMQEWKTNANQIIEKGLFVTTKPEVTENYKKDFEGESVEKLLIKAGKVGDRCEMTDGTRGVLAEDSGGTLICVPEKSEKDMSKHKVIKGLEEEHRRHGDEFLDHVVKNYKDLDMDDSSEIEKVHEAHKEMSKEAHEKHKDAVHKTLEMHKDEEFVKEMKDEFEDMHKAHKEALEGHHKDMCESMKDAVSKEDMKAFKEAIDIHKDAVKEEISRHKEAHLKCVKEALKDAEEMNDDTQTNEPDEKGITILSIVKKGEIMDILESNPEERQEKWEWMNFVHQAFGALCEAFYYSATPLGEFKTLWEEFVQLVDTYIESEKNESELEEIATHGSEVMEASIKSIIKKEYPYEIKSGRTISIKTKEALTKIAEALEESHGEHTKTIKEAIDVLREFGSGRGDGEEGGEKSHTRKSRSRSSTGNDYESHLIARRTLGMVESEIRKALKEINLNNRPNR